MPRKPSRRRRKDKGIEESHRTYGTYRSSKSHRSHKSYKAVQVARRSVPSESAAHGQRSQHLPEFVPAAHANPLSEHVKATGGDALQQSTIRPQHDQEDRP